MTILFYCLMALYQPYRKYHSSKSNTESIYDKVEVPGPHLAPDHVQLVPVHPAPGGHPADVLQLGAARDEGVGCEQGEQRAAPKVEALQVEERAPGHQRGQEGVL